MNYIHPFQLDEKLYSIGHIDELNSIHIIQSKRNQFPPHIVCSYFNNALNKQYITNFNCFYTGIECWVGKHNNQFIQDEKIRFILTKEHLSSLKNASILELLDKAHNQKNIVGASLYFNDKLGHIPLVLKLWIKKNLQKMDYSRTELTKQNAYIILKKIIKLQNQFYYKNLYPWQPSTYSCPHEQKMSQSILDEMLTVNKEFLLIDNKNDSSLWLKEYNPCWIEKFIF